MAKTMDDLLAEAEIRDLQMRYCRGADRRDFDLMRSCFHADATTDFGGFAGTLDAFIDAGRQTLAGYSATMHLTGNQLVEVTGDTAWAEHYAVAYHRVPADSEQPLRDFIVGIRYIDRVERRSGEWRIAQRAMALDWSRIDAVDERWTAPLLRSAEAAD